MGRGRWQCADGKDPRGFVYVHEAEPDAGLLARGWNVCCASRLEVGGPVGRGVRYSYYWGRDGHVVLCTTGDGVVAIVLGWASGEEEAGWVVHKFPLCLSCWMRILVSWFGCLGCGMEGRVHRCQCLERRPLSPCPVLISHTHVHEPPQCTHHVKSDTIIGRWL